jgi:hypothetical protein
VEPTLREHGVLLVDGQRDRAAAATAEEEAVRAVIGRPRPVPGQVRLYLVEAAVELRRRTAGK